jgi:hypothetical protein
MKPQQRRQVTKALRAAATAISASVNASTPASISARDLGRRDVNKFYVVIPFSEEHNKKEMADLSKGVLDGVLGISEKHEIIMQWYGMSRDAILVMDAAKLAKDNKLSRVQYDNPEYLVSNGMAALYRIFDKERTKSGSYSLAGNLIDHILTGTKPGKKPGGDILSEAKDLAGTIEKHAEELRLSVKALPRAFDDDYNMRKAVESVTERHMDASDIESFADFSGKAVKSLTEFSTSYDGLSARLIKLYLDNDYEMEPSDSAREVAALAPKAEAAALDSNWGWDANQIEALVKVMTDLATLVQDFDAIKALSKKASSEVASLSGDGAISNALGYDRGRALEKSFGDSGTDDIKTVKGLAKRVADVFKDGGHNYKDITLPAWERAIRKALKSIGNTFADEGEWLVKDKKLKIPSGSTLFVTKDEAVTPTLWDKEPVKADRFDQMIKKYDLDKRYKVQRIDRAKFDKARSLYLTSPKKVASSALKAAHKAVAEARKLLASTLAKKGHRFDTYFYGDDSGEWAASGAIFDFRKEWDWEMAPSLFSKNDWRNFSVEGATENNAGFRKALKAIVADYPEVADFWLSFDGPMKPVSEVLGLSNSDSWDDLVFLHGTSTTFLPTIEKEGLRPRGQTSVKPAYGHGSSAKPSNPDLLYFTTQETMAKFAARAAAAVHGGEPVILEVRNLDKAKAEPDEDSREKTAEASLARMGSIGYRGRVPASQVKARRSLSASARLAAKSFSDVDIPRDFRVMFFLPNEKVPTLGAQLARRQLEGVTGITDSGQVLMLRMLGANRNAMLVMPGPQTAKLNKLSRIMYENPEYWMSKDMAALIRVYGGSTDREAAINRIFQAAEKTPVSKSFMRAVSSLDLFPSAFPATPVNTVKDLAKQWFEVAKPLLLKKLAANDQKPTLNPADWDEWARDRFSPLLDLKAYEKAITDALLVIAKTFVWEGEWLLKDKTLRIPPGARLFITKPKSPYDQERFKAQQALIAEHGLDKVYKIAWVDGEKLQQIAMKYGMTAADKLVKQRLPASVPASASDPQHVVYPPSPQFLSKLPYAYWIILGKYGDDRYTIRYKWSGKSNYAEFSAQDVKKILRNFVIDNTWRSYAPPEYPEAKYLNKRYLKKKSG